MKFIHTFLIMLAVCFGVVYMGLWAFVNLAQPDINQTDMQESDNGTYPFYTENGSRE